MTLIAESAHAPQQTYTCTVHTQLHVCSMRLLCTVGAALVWTCVFHLTDLTERDWSPVNDTADTEPSTKSKEWVVFK